MISAARCFSDLPVESHPLTKILKVRINYEKQMEELNEVRRSFVKLIPFLEEQKVTSLVNSLKKTHSLAASVAQFGYKFTFNPDLLQHLGPALASPPLIYFSVVAFNCQNSGDLSILARILRTLKLIKEDKRSVVFSFCFALALESLNDVVTKCPDEVFHEVLTIIQESESLSPEIFPVIAEVFSVIGAQGSDESQVLLQTTVDLMLQKRYKCLTGQDISQLMEGLLVKLNALDIGCLNILSTILEQASGEIADQYFKLVCGCVRFFIEQLFKTEQIDLSRRYPDEVVDTTNLKPEIDFVLRDNVEMNPPLFDSLTSTLTLKEFLGMELHQKIMNFVHFGSNLPPSLRERFLSSYQQELCTSSDTILVYVTALALIAEGVMEHSFTNTAVGMILPTRVFNETHTIFRPDTMNPGINFVRKIVFEAVAKTDPDSIAQIIAMSVIYPVLLAENCLRVLLSFSAYNASIFVQDPTRTLLGATLLNLLKLRTDIGGIVRSSYLQFIFALVEQPAAAYGFLTSDALLPAYLSLVFERNMSDVTLFHLRKCIANADPPPGVECMDLVSEFIANVIAHCRVKKDEDGYMSLLMKCVETIVDGLQYRPRLSFPAVVVLDEILKCLEEWHDEVLVNYALSLLGFIFIAKPSFNWNKDRFQRFYQGIVQTFPEELPSRVLMKFWCILGDVSFVERKEAVLIRNPILLPLIFATTASYSVFPEVIKIWVGMCKYSYNSKISFHKGLIDRLLLQYLTNDSVAYKCVPIDIKTPQSKCRDDVFRLLNQIITEQTNFEVASRFCNLLALPECDQRLAKFIDKTVCAGTSAYSQLPVIPLDSCYPIMEVRNLPWDTMKTHFTFDIVGKFDDIASLKIDSKISVMEMTDGVTSLHFYLHNTMISATLSSPNDPPATVHLFKNVNVSEWARMTTCISKISRDPPQYRILNYLNRERLSETVLKVGIEFNTANLRLVIGGSDQSPEAHPTFFQFKEYRLYPFVPTPEQLLEMERGSETVTERAVFSASDQIANVRLPFCHTTESLLRYMCEGRLADKMAEVTSEQMLPATIDCLAYVFRRSPYAQTQFFGVDILLRKLRQASILNYQLYYSIYCALGAIQHKELRLSWFSRLVMNVWLWIQCDQSSLLKILCHWQTNLTSRHADLFRGNGYFSVLLTQFYIMFCLEKDKVPQFFQKSCVKKLSPACGEAFLKTISRVAKLSFTADDFDVLFSFATATDNPLYISHFVMTLQMLSRNPLVKQKMTHDHFALLHKLLRYSDRKLVRLVILCLHNLSTDDIFHHMIAAAFEVLSYNCIDKLFGELVSQIKTFPNLLPFLTVVALHFGTACVKKLATEMVKVNVQCYKPAVRHDSWYIFFVLLAFNVPSDLLSEFCVLFANCVLLSQSAVALERSLLVMLRLTLVKPDSNPLPYFLKHMNGIIQDDNKPFMSIMIRFCYYYLLLSLDNQPHSQGILEAFQHSSFDPVSLPQTSLDSDPLTIARVEALLDESLCAVNVSCHMRLNSEGKLENEYAGRMALSLIKVLNSTSPDAVQLEQNLIYFTNRGTLDPNVRLTISQHLGEIFEATQREFTRILKGNLEDFRHSFLKLLVASRQLISECEKSADAKNLSDVMLRHVATEMRRFERVEQGEQLVPEMKRRNLCSTGFIPTRRKRFSRRLGEIPPISSSVEIPCSMISLSGKRQYIMKMDSRQFVFLPDRHNGKTKSIGFSRVRMLFARPHLNAFEFYLVQGNVYLIEFDAKEFLSLSQKLQSIKYRNAECIQLGNNKPKVEDSMKRWVNRELSNFEYIMKLNIAAGYSIRKQEFYPVAPPVLTDIGNIKEPRTTYEGTTYQQVEIDIRADDLAKAFVGKPTILPDLYCDPFALTEDTSLPEWASSRHEFVYRARKVLESPSISLILHQWIDRIFGLKARINPQFVLFHKKHPSRNVVEKIQFSEFDCPVNTPLKHVVCVSTTRDQMVLGLIHKNNGIQFITFNWQTNPIKFQKKLIGYFKSETDDLYFDKASHHLAAYSQSQGKLFLVNESMSIQEVPFFAKSMLFASFSGMFLFATDKCTLSFCTFTAEGKAGIRQVCFVESEIIDIAVHQRLQIVALATLDERVHIYDVRSGECLGTHHTKKEIIQILVTSYWGFVIALARDEIFLYSQNGEFIKSHALDEVIDKAFSFTLTSGFDFLAYQNKNSEIVVFEAFYPENRLVVFKFAHDVLRVFYDHIHSNFVVVSKNGLIKVVSYNLSNYVC